MPLILTGAAGLSTLDSNTGLAIATWTTGTRPSSPVTGQFGYNTTTGQLEIYNATYANWTSAGTSAVTYTVEFLVVAGGGGGGCGYYGGGGGAGGYRNSYLTEPSGGGGSSETGLTFVLGRIYTITVGAGGTGSTSGTTRGSNGSDSSISGSELTTITSIGGGGGGSRNNSTSGVASAGKPLPCAAS